MRTPRRDTLKRSIAIHTPLKRTTPMRRHPSTRQPKRTTPKRSTASHRPLRSTPKKGNPSLRQLQRTTLRRGESEPQTDEDDTEDGESEPQTDEKDDAEDGESELKIPEKDGADDGESELKIAGEDDARSADVAPRLAEDEAEPQNATEGDVEDDVKRSSIDAESVDAGSNHSATVQTDSEYTALQACEPPTSQQRDVKLVQLEQPLGGMTALKPRIGNTNGEGPMAGAAGKRISLPVGLSSLIVSLAEDPRAKHHRLISQTPTRAAGRSTVGNAEAKKMLDLIDCIGSPAIFATAWEALTSVEPIVDAGISDDARHWRILKASTKNQIVGKIQERVSAIHFAARLEASLAPGSGTMDRLDSALTVTETTKGSRRDVQAFDAVARATFLPDEHINEKELEARRDAIMKQRRVNKYAVMLAKVYGNGDCHSSTGREISLVSGDSRFA